MQVKTYNNIHTCHRIYKSQEVRSKWIASKFEVLVKNNPSIQCGVISDLLRDQFNVSVNTQRLYKAKKRALEVLLKEHTKCFSHLKGFCARHIYANFSTKYSGQKMSKLFWKASKTGEKHEFKKCLGDISSINPEAMAYLAAIKPCHWSRHAFDNSIKCDHVTNNMTEAFNSMLKDFRASTYLGLMEYIRRMVMSRFQLRKKECSRWGQGKYKMLGLNKAYTTNLNDKTCECGQWQVSGVPCSHALAGIIHHFGVNGNQSSLEEFIDPALSKAAYLRTYNYMIHPILDLCVWGDHVGAPIQPPPLRRKPGRPKLLRKRESTEKPKAARSGCVVYGKCKLPRHNSRACKTEGIPIENKASKKQPTVSEDECAASSSKPSKKRQRASAKHVIAGDKSSQPTTHVQTQPISQVTQLD
ncbi:hypothetical protein Q3G72_027140 [Acer saccharum]|nr:hypothetical protein Q3G72_027140 [Acer saccharum]